VIPIILELEGGYNPDDEGAPSNYGINYKYNRQRLKRYGINEASDMIRLTKEQAKAIYKKDYWDERRFSKMPIKLAATSFDAAVQHGPTRARLLTNRSKDHNQLIANRLRYYRGLKTYPKNGAGWENRMKRLKVMLRNLGA